MSTLFVWTGKAGPDWNSVSGTITNWVITPGGSNTIVPTSDTTLEAVAVFNDGGIHNVGGGGSADQFSITDNTTVTLTGDRFEAGAFDPVKNADFPDDLVVDGGSKLVVASGAGLQNQGTVDVIGLGNELFGGSGDGTLEVDPGGIYETQGLIIGDGTAGVGLVTINGAGIFSVVAPGSLATGNGQVTIGYAGTGSLAITNTAAVFTQSGVLGLNQGAVGSLSLDSSTWGGGGVTLGAAGTGHMTIGSGAVVALYSIVMGAAQTGSGDLFVTSASIGVDFLTVGQDGTGTATFGPDSIGTFATVTVGDSASAIANLTLDGATWNTGSLTIGLTGTGHATAGAGEVITVNNAILGSGAGASGDLTLDGAVLNGGTVVIGQDGTGDLAIGSGSSGSVAAVVAGEDADSSGTLTIDGADWTVGSLTVGLAGSGLATVGNGATATFDNVLIGPNGELDATGAGGGLGTVIASSFTLDFGMVDVTGGGEVLVGASSGPSGAVSVDGTASPFVGLGAVKGNVVLGNQGTVEATQPIPGSLLIDGNVHGTGTLEPLMTLEVNGGIDAGVDIAFSGSVGAQVGDLVLDVPGAEKGTITGFGVGNMIDVQGSVYTDAVFMQGGTGQPGTLMLSGGTFAPLSLLVEGTYAADSFMATPGASDTVVTFIPCFAAGTRIATERGMVAVEVLRKGDWVRTLLGSKSRPVTWLGHRHVDCARHSDPKEVWPICVSAGAFGPARPYRDLFLSPDHALFINGVLVPVRYLVNGRTIFQVERDEVSYWHVELAEHNVLFAEGVPAESYLDTGNRSGFANGGPAVDLHPNFSREVWDERGCAPLVLNGPGLAAARRRLLLRASAQGHLTTDDAALEVWVNGRKRPARVDGRIWRVRVPTAARVVRLVSRAWHPAHMQPDADDRRALGVAISRLWLDGNEVHLDSPMLSLGWHAREQEWRWTDGDAALVIAGARELAFEVKMTGIYWREDERGARRVA